MADEILKDEQLDEVAGGSYTQSYDQMIFLSQRMGIKFVAHNSDDKPNEYYNAVTGEVIAPGAAFQHLVNTINAYRAQGVVIN